MKKKVYIAGPYTKGDVCANVAKAMEAWHELHTGGFVPFCPHLSHFLHLQRQLPYNDWLSQDLEWVRVCNAVLRLPGESAGADQETAFAEKQGIPVFTTFTQLCDWGDEA